jgi:hypothetical protein
MSGISRLDGQLIGSSSSPLDLEKKPKKNGKYSVVSNGGPIERRVHFASNRASESLSFTPLSDINLASKVTILHDEELESPSSTSEEYINMFPLLLELYQEDPILVDHLTNLVQVMNLENDMNNQEVHPFEIQVRGFAQSIGQTLVRYKGVYMLDEKFIPIVNELYKSTNIVMAMFNVGAHLWQEKGLNERRRYIQMSLLEEAIELTQAIDRQEGFNEKEIEHYPEHPIHLMRRGAHSLNLVILIQESGYLLV